MYWNCTQLYAVPKAGNGLCRVSRRNQKRRFRFFQRFSYRCVTCPLHDPSTEDGIDTVSLPSSSSYGRVTSSWIGCRVFWGPFAPHLALSYPSISAVSPSQKSSGRKTSFTLGKSQCLLTTSAGFLYPGMWWKRMIPAATESRVRWYAKALWRLWSLE